MAYNLIRTWGMLCCILLIGVNAFAYNGNPDSLKRIVADLPLEEAITLHHLPQLNQYIQNTESFNIPLNAGGSMPEFTPQYIANNFAVSAEMADYRSQAVAVLDEIERKQNYIDKLLGKYLVELPVGMKKSLGNTNVTLAVSKAKFLPTHTLLTVFCKIDLPQGRSIFFGADSVQLSLKGGIINAGNLVLLGDFQIPFNGGNSMLTLKGGFDLKTGNIDYSKTTFARMSCNGIESINIAADFAFPRSLLIPLTDDFKVVKDSTKKVQGSFNIRDLKDWNDMYADINLPPFAIKGLDSIAFKLQSAFIDMSDYTNGSFTFPTDYANPLAKSPLWRGVYIKQFDVILPQIFKKKGSTERTRFTATNLIFDNTGITGLVTGSKVIDVGSASGWDFSVDSFYLQMQSNTLRRAGFRGAIAIPVSKKQNESDAVKKYGLAYNAMFLSANDYLMNVLVKEKDSLSFDIWKAKAIIASGSYVELAAKNGRFKPKAVLNGKLNVNTGGVVKLNNIVFQELTIQSEEPYVSIKQGGFSIDLKSTRQSSVANFPIEISGVEVKVENNKAKIVLKDLKVLLMEGKAGASGTIAVVAEFSKPDEDNFKFDYKDLEISKLGVEGDFGGFAIKGNVEWFNKDTIMGTGFRGDLELTLGIAPGKDPIKIDAAAAFGRRSYRYWYVDVMASGFKIPIGPLNITGLGGGVSSRMIRNTNVAATKQQFPSGIAFTPDSTIGLGFRAKAAFEVGTSTTANGDVMLEMLFNADGGGLARIGLYGKATIIPSADLVSKYKDTTLSKLRLTKLFKSDIAIIAQDTTHDTNIKNGNYSKVAEKSSNENASESTGSIFASVGIEFDFRRKSLNANFSVDINIADGIITGGGQARLHIRPEIAELKQKQRWYLFLGTSEPGKELKVKFSFAGFDLNTRTYFMVGDSIGSSPPPPTEVARILGRSIQELDYMRDMNNLEQGGGFAFGAHLSARLDTDFGYVFKFYTKFSAGIGFDIMLKRYLNKEGNPLMCTNTNEVVGIKGWYANGQAYAYLSGELGIRVKLWFIKKDIPIISIGAAVLLQAKGPKPTWFTGYLAGRFSVLDGLIDGSFSCKATFGTQCQFQDTNPIAEQVEFITKIVPDDGTTGVNPLNAVQVSFKYPLDKEFLLSNGESGEQASYNTANLTEDEKRRIAGLSQKKLIARIKTFDIIKSNGNKVSNAAKPYLITNNGMMAEYTDAVTLPSDESLTVKVEVEFFKKSNGNESPFVLDGQPYVQTKIIKFKTSKASSVIPLNNIEFTYPVIDQKYYLQKESNKGVIKLRRNQEYLVKDTTTTRLTFTNKQGVVIEQPVIYSVSTKEFTFDLPVLENSQSYVLNIDAVNKSNGKFRSILKYNFSTSRHNLFSQKLLTYKPKYFESVRKIDTLLVERLYTNIVPESYVTREYSFISFIINTDIEEIEPFDAIELSGSTFTSGKPLIQPEADLGNDYFTNSVAPILWAPYDNGILQISRDAAIYGRKPSKAIIPLNVNSDSIPAKRFPYVYAVSNIMAKDHRDFREQIMRKYALYCRCYSNNNELYGNAQIDCENATNPVVECLDDIFRKNGNNEYIVTDWERLIASEDIPELATDKYNVFFKYMLPTQIEPTSGPIFSYYHTNSIVKADAGIDQINQTGNFTANAQGEGTWTIVNAPTGFTVSNILPLTSKNAAVSGIPVDKEVTLRWSVIQSSGAELSDIVTFYRVSKALAGDDQTSFIDTFNIKGNALGTWSVISQDVCNAKVKILKPNDAQTSITGLPWNKPVTLRWTLADGTNSLYDDIVITKKLPDSLIGMDIVQYDSLFVVTSKVNGGIWLANGETYGGVLDSAAQTTEVYITEPNKLVTLTYRIKDSNCDQNLDSKIKLLWAKADLGDNQCLGNGSFTLKGYGNGQWSISGLSISIDSFITNTEGSYLSTFNLPVSRLPENGFITIKWTMENGEDEVRLRRLSSFSAGLDQTSTDSIFNLAATGGDGQWEIASAPAGFDISKIVDFNNPNTTVTLPDNSTVKLVWRVQDECRNEVDTVVLVRKKAGKVIEGMAGPDWYTDGWYGRTAALGEGTWSILSKPQSSMVTSYDVITNPSIYVYFDAVPVDSFVIMRWTNKDGDYDDMTINKKKHSTISMKLFLEKWYNANTGLMTIPVRDSVLASVPSWYPKEEFITELQSDTNIVSFVRITFFQKTGGYNLFYKLRPDGTLVSLKTNSTDIEALWINNSDSKGFICDLLINDNYHSYSIPNFRFRWGENRFLNLTKDINTANTGSIIKSHPTLGDVFVIGSYRKDEYVVNATNLPPNSLVKGLADGDRETSNSFIFIQGKGEGHWSIVSLPKNMETIDTSQFFFGNGNSNRLNVWVSMIPIDSSITLKWTTTQGYYDYLKITYRNEIKIKAKIYLEQLYKPQLGYMTKSNNFDSLVMTLFGYESSIYAAVKEDSTFVDMMRFGSSGGNGSREILVFLKSDGTIVNLAELSDEIDQMGSFFYSNETSTRSSVLIFKGNIFNNYKYNPLTDQQIRTLLNNPEWGSVIPVDFTNGSIQNPNLIPKAHPTLGTIYVLKIE
jgi:hypothetical protein